MSPAGRPGRAARRRARALPPPLDQREGLDPVHWTVPPATQPMPALEALQARFPPLGDPSATPLARRFACGEVVGADGRAWAAGELVGPGDELWFHRELRAEHVPRAELRILHRDEHLLVLDKPHDMATMPRGAHVRSSALVRLRRATGITTLTPLHRLDRRTAGVLAFGIRTQERAAYQQLFARGAVRKDYLARVTMPRGDHAPARIPTRAGARATLRDRLHKQHGELTTDVVSGEPNVITELEVLAQEANGTLLLRLRPLTGRTHQLRAQLAARGAPIRGEDLYPQPASAADGDPAPGTVLALLARSLSFTDPITGQERCFTSSGELGPGERQSMGGDGPAPRR